MLSDRELWACANEVLKTHGNKSALFVTEQIGALFLAEVEDGIKPWQAIARRIAELSSDQVPPSRQ